MNIFFFCWENPWEKFWILGEFAWSDPGARRNWQIFAHFPSCDVGKVCGKGILRCSTMWQSLQMLLIWSTVNSTYLDWAFVLNQRCTYDIASAQVHVRHAPPLTCDCMLEWQRHQWLKLVRCCFLLLPRCFVVVQMEIATCSFPNKHTTPFSCCSPYWLAGSRSSRIRLLISSPRESLWTREGGQAAWWETPACWNQLFKLSVYGWGCPPCRHSSLPRHTASQMGQRV